MKSIRFVVALCLAGLGRSAVHDLKVRRVGVEERLQQGHLVRLQLVRPQAGR